MAILMKLLPLIVLIVGFIVACKILYRLYKPYLEIHGSMRDEFNYGISRGTAFTYRRTYLVEPEPELTSYAEVKEETRPLTQTPLPPTLSLTTKPS